MVGRQVLALVIGVRVPAPQPLNRKARVMQYLIYGAGWIGNAFKEYLPKSELSGTDITNYQEVKRELEEKRPRFVINTAGKTGKPNIDWCESHKLETVHANVSGPLVLLRATQEAGVRLVHISSGCIYEGDKEGAGWTEDDPPNFYGSLYSRTKIWAEEPLREFSVLILRIRMPFDDKPHSRNLITKLTQYPSVIAVPNSITYLPDFLRAAEVLMQKEADGVYHIVNPEPVTHSEILDLYREIVDPSYAYSVISLDDLLAKVRAPRSNCVLSAKKAQEAGVSLLPTREALRKAMEAYRASFVS